MPPLAREDEKPTFEVGDRFKADERKVDFLLEVPEEFREHCQGEVIGAQVRWHGQGGTIYTLQTSKGWFQCLGMEWAKKAVKINEPAKPRTTA